MNLLAYNKFFEAIKYYNDDINDYLGHFDTCSSRNKEETYNSYCYNSFLLSVLGDCTVDHGPSHYYNFCQIGS